MCTTQRRASEGGVVAHGGQSTDVLPYTETELWQMPWDRPVQHFLQRTLKRKQFKVTKKCCIYFAKGLPFDFAYFIAPFFSFRYLKKKVSKRVSIDNFTNFRQF